MIRLLLAGRSFRLRAALLTELTEDAGKSVQKHFSARFIHQLANMAGAMRKERRSWWCYV